jgi:hypothetical protein
MAVLVTVQKNAEISKIPNPSLIGRKPKVHATNLVFLHFIGYTHLGGL